MSEDEEEPTVETLRERLDALSERLDAAETEADLDEVAEDLEALEADVEAADLPEPDDDEEETPPEEELVDEVEALESDLEAERGPYQSDAVGAVEEAVETVRDGEWTEDGEADVADAVAEYVVAVDEYVDAPAFDTGDPALAQEALESVAETIDGLDLDPDDDAATIAALLEATEALQEDLEAAEEWDDLSVREQLQARGFYDVVDHNRDYPPEWTAIKSYERRGEAEPIVHALQTFDSDFMEDNCLDALERLGDEAALEEMLSRAQKRDKRAIRILGKIGSDEAVDQLLEYTDADVGLRVATLRALGEIGSEDAVQPVADQLAADESEARSAAARSLGLLGDPRAVDPLSDVLDDEDEDGSVRASAAWALVQIGTEEALSTAGEYADDREYLVQAEAEKARDAAPA